MAVGYSKEQQLGRTKKKVDKLLKDKMAKRLCAMIYVACEHMEEVEKLIRDTEWDHVKNRASHRTERWLPNNWQLLSMIMHRKKTDTGKYIDYRTDNIKQELENITILFENVEEE
jgi:hypothetical protein